MSAYKHIKSKQFTFLIIFGLLVVLPHQGCGVFHTLEDKGIEENSSLSGNLPTSLAPGKASIRLLNGKEYSNTIPKVVGVPVSKPVDHADASTGYVTGAGLMMDENLFSIFYNEAQILAKAYVTNLLLKEFPCFSKVDTACVTNFISTFGKRAFRRPLKTEERQSFTTLYNNLINQSGTQVNMAREFLVVSFLISPHFLYRTEIGTVASGVRRLTVHEIASFVSYSVTGNMPDNLLMTDADSGKLSSASVLREHIRRLLTTASSKEYISGFFKQWLKLEALDLMATNPTDFSKLASEAQGRALRDEFDLFVHSIVFDEKGSLRNLFLDNRVYINSANASIYGETSSSSAFRLVRMNPNQRKGMLTLAGVMASHASAGDMTKDRPVMRGALVKEQLLCESVGLPSGLDLSAATDNVLEKFPTFMQMTVRGQFEAIMQQGQSCVSCHSQFMPYGYLASNFGALGQFQSVQNGKPIDSYDEALLDGRKKQYINIVDFISDVADSQSFHNCFGQNFARFIAGMGSGSNVNSSGNLIGYYSLNENRAITAIIEDILTREDAYIRKGVQ